MTPRLLAALMTLGLSACDTEPPPGSPTRPESGPTAEPVGPAPPAPASTGWSFEQAGGEAGLRLARGGRLVVRFWCTRSDGMLRVQGHALTSIPSEDRLTVGAGDEAHALTADLASRAVGVTAGGPIPPAWLDAVEAGGRLSLSYGAQTLGPLDAVPAAERAAFTAGCRAAVVDG